MEFEGNNFKADLTAIKVKLANLENENS